MNKYQSVTGGDAGILKPTVNAIVMLTVNAYLEDRLVDGQLGTIKCIHKIVITKLKKVVLDLLIARQV